MKKTRQLTDSRTAPPLRTWIARARLRRKQAEPIVVKVVGETLEICPGIIDLECPLAHMGADDLDAEEIVYYCEVELNIPEGVVWRRVTARPSRLTVGELTNLCLAYLSE